MSKFIVIGLFILLAYQIPGISQSDKALVYKVIDQYNFDAANGFSGICVKQLWIDYIGRLWIKYCDNRLYFIGGKEFVNGKSFFQGLYSYGNPTFSYMDKSGNSCGQLVVPNSDSIQLFWYQAVKGQYCFQTLPVVEDDFSKIFFFKATTENALWVCLLRPRSLALYKWRFSSNQLQLQCQIPIPANFITSNNFDSDGSWRLQFHANQFWIYSLKDTAPSYWVDVNQQSIQAIPIDSQALRHSQDNQVLFNMQKKILVYRDTILYCNPFLSKQLLYFDSTCAVWKPYPLLKEKGAVVNLYQDVQENLLGVYENKQGERHAILLKTNGLQFDFTNMLPFQERISDIVSEDFEQQIVVGTATAIHAIEVGRDLKIQTFFTANSIRWMAEFASNNVVAGLRNVGWKIISDQYQVFNNQLINFCEPKPHTNPEWLSSVASDARHNIWRTYRSKLCQYDLINKRCQCFSLPVDTIFSNTSPLLVLKEQNIALFNTNNHRLYFFDISSRQLTIYQENGSIKTFPASANQILQTRNGHLLLATERGWYNIDLDKQKSVVRQADQNIMVAYEDRPGKIWLGSIGDGLSIFDPKTDSTTILTTRNGLANNKVVSILEDAEGMIWAGTYNGLAVISAEGKVIANLYQQNGLSSNEFNRFSQLKTSDGKLWFGSINGLNVIDPAFVKSQLPAPAAPAFYLTSLTWYDTKTQQEIVQQDDLDAIKKICLSPWHRYLSLRFAVNNYTNSLNNQYEYQLTNTKEDWQRLGNQSFLDLNNLPIGKYDLFIRGANAKKQWTDHPIRLTIEVRPFFFQTAWFYTIIVLIVLSTLYFTFYKKKKKQAPAPPATTSVVSKETTASTASTKSSLIEQAHQFIEDNIQQENLGVQDICNALNISRTKLHNTIKDQTGMSTTYYIRRVRLERAKMLLETSDLTVAEIAHQVGYKYPKYFSRLFSEEFAKSPSEFRKSE